MRILFIGESWQGSSARSLSEALAMQRNVTVADIGSDRFLPAHRGLPLRIANRLLRPLQQDELERAVHQAVSGFHPDALVVYKGVGIRPSLIKALQSLGYPVVNVFPDYSPHAYGPQLQESMGLYDLVVSTKPFHPPLWLSVYGYTNRCVCVPHGYDPEVHLWSEAASSHEYDVALCSRWRDEYHHLMRALARALSGDEISVAIAGSDWLQHRDEFPRHWHFAGPKLGRAYGDFLRSAKIALAPVNRDVVIRGARQPGDEDTTRTYELAAANCFFLHQRTDYVTSIYDQHTEVPMWNDAAELAALIKRWLPDLAGRQLMAARAHARAVPAYSIPQRAVSVLQHVSKVIDERRVSTSGP
jgi:glycosyl transferase family 1